MTEEMIINGVNVSECEVIAKEDEYSSYDRVYKGQCRCSNEEMCKNHPNCFYKKALKQLKRKEQECEGLKKNVEHWKMEHKEAKAKGEWTYDLVKKRLGQQLDQLKAEKEKLKKECEIWKNQVLTIDDEAITVQITQQQFEEYDKLKQTLAEIKEIAGHQCNICEALTPVDEYKDCKKCWQGKILQKISKCEVKHV